MVKLKPTWYCGIVIVRGDGAFPLDMLRYDNCVPSTQEDVIKLTDDGRRLIQLGMFAQSLAGLRPTKERWESFGWEVVV